MARHENRHAADFQPVQPEKALMETTVKLNLVTFPEVNLSK